MSTQSIQNRIKNTFIQLCQTKGVKDLVKEAKRVKYNVVTESGSDTGKSDIWRYEVTDEGNLVFKAMLVRINAIHKVVHNEPPKARAFGVVTPAIKIEDRDY